MDASENTLKYQSLSSASVLSESNEGWVIGSSNDRLLRLKTDKHMVTIANTGGGKGTSVAIANLLTHPGSVFSIEIGGATYNTTHQVRKFSLGQKVHVIDPYCAVSNQSSHLNLLDTLDPESPRFFNEVKLFASSILKNDRGSSSQERYWEDVPKQALMAFLIYAKISSSLDDTSRNLPYVAQLISLYGSDEWKKLMGEFSDYTGKGAEIVQSTGNYFGKDRNENTDSIISSIQSALSFAYDPAVANISRDSSFKLSDLRDSKTTIYVVMPEAEDYAGLSTWLRLLVERSFSACPNQGDGGRRFGENHEDRVLFMLDEFTQLGRLEAVDTGMQTARQKGVTIWAMFQDLGRLQSVYGEDIADSMLGAAAVTQVFDIGDMPTLEYVSKRMGQEITYLKQTQEGTSDSNTTEETNQVSTARGQTSSRSESDTNGWSDSDRQKNKSNSKETSSGTSDQLTETKSTSYSKTTSSSLTTSYNAQIIPKLAPDQVEVLLGSGDNQLLFIRAKISGSQREVCRAIHSRAPFYDHPKLKKLAEGCWEFKAPPTNADYNTPLLPDRLNLPEALVQSPPLMPEFISTNAIAKFVPVDPLSEVIGSTIDENAKRKIRQVWKQYVADSPDLDSLDTIEQDELLFAGSILPALEQAGRKVEQEFDSAQGRVRDAWNALSARQIGLAGFYKQCDRWAEGVENAFVTLQDHGFALNKARNTLDAINNSGVDARIYQDYEGYLDRVLTEGAVLPSGKLMSFPKAPAIDLSKEDVSYASVPEAPLPNFIWNQEIEAPPQLPVVISCPQVDLASLTTLVGSLNEEKPTASRSLRARAVAIADWVTANIKGKEGLQKTDADRKNYKKKLLAKKVSGLRVVIDQSMADQQKVQAWEKASLNAIAQAHLQLDQSVSKIKSHIQDGVQQSAALAAVWACQDLMHDLLDSNVSALRCKRQEAFNKMASSPKWHEIYKKAKLGSANDNLAQTFNGFSAEAIESRLSGVKSGYSRWAKGKLGR